ncbi:MAG: alpha/beta hydrolase [Proteobacteria bacterium]|nr:alpha/beta hydrolase [Pseudomonadota bacterium]
MRGLFWGGTRVTESLSRSWEVEQVTFRSGRVHCVGSLYRPREAQAVKLPCLILGHGFGGVRSLLAPYAEAFAARGWAVLTFDYRGFGDSEGEQRQVLKISDQLADWHAAIAFAKTLPMVDALRIGLWGSSLGGGHVITVAASDPSIKAAVAQVPHVDGLAALRTAGWRHGLLLAPSVVHDFVAWAVGGRRVMVPLIGRPGDEAMMTGDASADFIAHTQAVAPSMRVEVAAAAGLAIALYSPIRFISRVRCPLLMLVADRDGTAPAAKALAAAARAPHCEVVRYDVQHFDIYLEPTFHVAVAAQIDFFERWL